MLLLLLFYFNTMGWKMSITPLLFCCYLCFAVGLWFMRALIEN